MYCTEFYFIEETVSINTTANKWTKGLFKVVVVLFANYNY